MPDARVGITAPRLGLAVEVPEGGARGYDPEGRGQHTVFALRHRGQLHLWRDRCPHAGTPMAWRRHAYLNAAGDRIICAAHGAQFEPDTGLCVLGPCLGERLQAVPFAIDSTGEIVLTSPGTSEGMRDGHESLD